MRGSITLLNQPYEEAQTLLKTSRDYIKWQAPLDIQNMSNTKSSKVTRESLRVAIRLSQITVWLTLQQSIHKGEISHEESLSKDYQILQGPVCLDSKAENDQDLPLRLRELLQMSRLLYVRILRLDRISRQRHLSSREIKKEKKIRVV